ncbi:MAG: hypothetical protein SNJ69_12525 [Chloroflexaceae bacterium]
MRNAVPPSSPSLLTLLFQLIGAVIVGVLAGVLLAYLVSLLLMTLGIAAQLGMGLLSVQVFLAIIGFGAGAGLGAALVGRLSGQMGSLWLAMLAGAVTSVLVVLGMRLLRIGGLAALLWVGLTLPLAAAIGAYYLRRRAR